MLAAALLIAAACAATPVAGQAPGCMPRVHLGAILEERYGETPISAGLSTTGSLVEVFASADRSTWTLAVSSPQGISCVVAIGENWLDVAPTPPVPPDGT